MTTASDLRARMRARVDKLHARGDATWYEIKNATGERATIRLYEEIGYWGVTAADFAAELEHVTATEIEVQINSPGGDVFDGIAIFNALRSHPARVTTRVDGIAASAASVIVQAGDHRVMVSAGQMMVHEAWGVAIGPADEIRAFADVLDQQNDVLAGIYALRSGRDRDELRAMMRAETWLTDQAAVDAGLADVVFTPERQDAPAEAEASQAFDEAEFRSLVDRLVEAGIVRTAPATKEESALSIPEDAAASLLAAFTRTEEPG